MPAWDKDLDAPPARRPAWEQDLDAPAVAPVVRPTERQELLSSTPMRVAKGAKDPIDGTAQLLRRGAEYTSAMNPFGGIIKAVTGKSPGDMIDSAANAIGGEGTFLGDVLGIKGATPQQLQQDVAASGQEYEAARTATGQEGFDGARLAGNVLSPANIIAARAAPVPNIASGTGRVAAQGAAGGAIGAGLQPVAGENFAGEKAGQVMAGAAGGAVLAPVAAAVGNSAGKVLDAYRRRGTMNVTPEGLRFQITRQLAQDGVDVDSIPDQVFAKLTDDVQKALVNGKQLDPAAALRAQDFEAIGAPFLQGQVTRNPAQWQREFNLAGVDGVGEPLQNVMAQQGQVVSNRMNQMSRGAGEMFDDAGKLMDLGKTAQGVRQDNVRQAYNAYKQSNGRDLEVPLQGLAQDYAETFETFGDAIPAAVRSKFEKLGLMDGTQRQMLSIDQAENLIKAINANMDPMNRVRSNALGKLRASVQNAITSVADSDAEGAMSAQLAKEARGFAAENFKNLEATPALRAAMENMEPDQFIQRFVMQGKVNEIKRLAEAVGPEGQDIMKAQFAQHLQAKAFGANVAGDGKAAQATFNNELRKIGRPKLEAILGKDGADEMFRIGRVLAYIKQTPEGATPNTSGSGQMITSMVGKMRGIKGLPYVEDWIVRPLSRYGDRQAVQQSLSGVPQQAAQLDPKTIEALSALFAPVPVAGGAALGYSTR